jgi:hypothetical protein
LSFDSGSRCDLKRAARLAAMMCSDDKHSDGEEHELAYFTVHQAADMAKAVKQQLRLLENGRRRSGLM